MSNQAERWRASEAIQKRARELRKEMTPAERRLWQALRGNALDGAYFRRQHAIGNFILDFYCAKSKLAVEVDGGIHLDRAVDDPSTSSGQATNAHAGWNRNARFESYASRMKIFCEI